MPACSSKWVHVGLAGEIFWCVRRPPMAATHDVVPCPLRVAGSGFMPRALLCPARCWPPRFSVALGWWLLAGALPIGQLPSAGSLAFKGALSPAPPPLITR